MVDAETASILERIAVALERIADNSAHLAEHFAPQENGKEKRPATLTTAIYSREERERRDLREHFQKKTPKSTPGTPPPSWRE